MLQEKYLKIVSERRREPQEKLLTQAKEMNLQKIEKERYSAMKNKQKKMKLITSGNKSKFDISNSEVNDTKGNENNNSYNAGNQYGNSQNISITLLPPIEQSKVNKDGNENENIQNVNNEMMKDIIDQF